MEIVFDEILVGERGRAHDVLASTLPDEVARSLAHHLDLPGQLPPGFELQSYVSGFPQGDRYVFARTSLDSRASRQGMVFSHALVCDLDVVQDLCNVAAVFDSLKAARPPRTPRNQDYSQPLYDADEDTALAGSLRFTLHPLGHSGCHYRPFCLAGHH